MNHEQSCEQRKRRRSATSNTKLVKFFIAGFVFCGAVSAKATTTTGSFPARLPSSMNGNESQQHLQSSTKVNTQSSEVNNNETSAKPSSWFSDAAAASGGGGESDDGGGTEDEVTDVEEASSSDFEDSSNVWMSLEQDAPKDDAQPDVFANSHASATHVTEQPKAISSVENMEESVSSEGNERMSLQGNSGIDDDKKPAHIESSDGIGGASKILQGPTLQPEGGSISSSSGSPRLPSSFSRSQLQQPRLQPSRRTTQIPTQATAPIGSQPLQTLEKLQQMLDETDYMTANNSRQAATRTSPITASSAVSRSAEKGRRPSDVGQQKATQPEKLWTSKDRAKYKKQQQRLRRAEQEQEDLDASPTTKPVVYRNFDNGSPAVPSATRPSQSVQDQNLYSTNTDEEEDYSDDTTDDGLGYSLPDLPVYYSDAEDEGEMSAADEESSSASSPWRQRQSPHSLQQDPFQQRLVQEQRYTTQGSLPLSPQPGANPPGATRGAGAAGSSYVPPPPNYYPYHGPQAPLSPEQQYLMQQRRQQYSQFPPPGPYAQQQQNSPLQTTVQQPYLPYSTYPPYPIPPNPQQNGYALPYPYPPSYYTTAQQQQQAYAEQYATWAAAAGYAQLPPEQLGANAGYTQQQKERPAVNSENQANSVQQQPLSPSPPLAGKPETDFASQIEDATQQQVKDKYRSATVSGSKPKVALKIRQPFTSPSHVVGTTVSLLPEATMSPFPIVASHPNAWLSPVPQAASSDERVDRVSHEGVSDFTIVICSQRLTVSHVPLLNRRNHLLKQARACLLIRFKRSVLFSSQWDYSLTRLCRPALFP
jgi:hypothetical protein